MSLKIIKKAFVNKNNKQLTLTIPKRALPPRLKYSKDLFFEIKPYKEKKQDGL